MKEKILRILTNHRMSSLEGLHQITGGSKDELASAVESMIEEGIIYQTTSSWNGTDWIVYKLKKKDLVKS